LRKVAMAASKRCFKAATSASDSFLPGAGSAGPSATTRVNLTLARRIAIQRTLQYSAHSSNSTMITVQRLPAVSSGS
jgi:hypothetical protein